MVRFAASRVRGATVYSNYGSMYILILQEIRRTVNGCLIAVKGLDDQVDVSCSVNEVLYITLYKRASCGDSDGMLH